MTGVVDEKVIYINERIYLDHREKFFWSIIMSLIMSACSSVAIKNPTGLP